MRRANIDIELDEEYYDMKQKRENALKRKNNAKIRKQNVEKAKKEQKHNKKVCNVLLILLLIIMFMTFNLFLYTIGGVKKDIIYELIKWIFIE